MTQNNSKIDAISLAQEAVRALERDHGHIYRDKNGAAFVGISEAGRPGFDAERTIAAPQIRAAVDAALAPVIKALQDDVRSLVVADLEQRPTRPSLADLSAEVARLRAELAEAKGAP